MAGGRRQKPEEAGGRSRRRQEPEEASGRRQVAGGRITVCYLPPATCHLPPYSLPPATFCPCRLLLSFQGLSLKSAGTNSSDFATPITFERPSVDGV